jgi:hypothetical protein
MSLDYSSQQVKNLNRIAFRPWDPQVIATVVRFDLAERLAHGPKTVSELAAELDAHHESMGMFLRAAAVVDLVSTEDGETFSITELGKFLCSHEVGLRNVVMMSLTPGIWNRAGRMYETILTGKTVLDENGEDLYDYYRHAPDEREWHAAAMADLSRDAGASIAEHYDLDGVSTVVDVGGSLGVLMTHLLRAAPKVKGVVFDLPDIVEKGRKETSGTDVADRISFVGGSFFVDDAPGGGDLYLLKQVLCDWGDEDSAKILDCIYRGAPSGARFVVVEWVRPDKKVPSEFDSMSLGLQAVGGGRIRTEEELRGLIEAAGFRFESTVTVPSGILPRPWHLLTAVRP